MLEAYEGYHVEDCGSAEEAIELLSNKKFEVVLLDISLPGMDGIQALNQFRNMFPEVAIIMLTMYYDEPYLKNALKAGASGYILKDAATTELIDAIKNVLKGELAVNSSLLKNLIEVFQKNSCAEKNYEDNETVLTPREEEILAYIALGYTNRDIAANLFISIKTVEKHKSNLMEKLDLKKRHELVEYAINNGLVDMENGITTRV